MSGHIGGYNLLLKTLNGKRFKNRRFYRCQIIMNNYIEFVYIRFIREREQIIKKIIPYYCIKYLPPIVHAYV